MKHIVRSLSLLGACLAAGSAAAQAPRLPELAVPVIAAPRLDGALDDAGWRQAAVISNFTLVGAPGSRAVSGPHAVYVGRDAEWLYVGFRVEQAAADRNPVSFFRHDETVQREDNVQVSFDPGTDGATYYQFLLNRGNTRADFRMTHSRGREREGWNIPWRSAVSNADAFWSAELALPFCLMLEVGDVERARFNVLIDTFVPQRDASGVKLDVVKTEYSWAPLKLQFHEPDLFGRLVGLKPADFKAPFLPFLEDAAVTGYRTDNGQMGYGVRAALRSCSGHGGAVALEVHERRADGRTLAVTNTFDFGDTVREQAAEIFVPTDTLVQREVILRAVHPGTGEVLQSLPLPDVSALDLFSALLDRNYYTGESNALACCSIGLPDLERAGLRLAAVSASGMTLSEQPVSARDAALAIPLAGLAPGRHALDIQLRYPDGRVASSTSLSLLKREPRESEWKIDQVRCCLLKNGEPFFPFGFIMSSVTAGRDDCFQDVAGGGFNTVQQWSYRPSGPDDADAYLKAAARHGLNVISVNDIYCNYDRTLTLDDPAGLLTPERLAAANQLLRTAWFPLAIGMKDVLLETARHLAVADQSRLYEAFYAKCAPDLAAARERAQGHANLIGYFILDEPMDGSHGAGKLYYDDIHAQDGYHPVFVLYSSYIDDPVRAVTWVDALGTDPYWNFGKEGDRGRVTFVSKVVTMTRRVAERSHKVPWSVLVGEAWSQTWKRVITPAEQRCQTYLALISGSKGILYFNYANLFTRAVWDALSELAREMQTLGPCCLTPAIPQEVRYSTGPLNPEKDQFPDVQAALVRHPDGRFVLLAVNTATHPVRAEFALPLLGADGTVGALFDDRAWPVQGGAFRDEFEPYGTRAYVLPAGALPAGPVSIAVALEADPARALKEEPQIAHFNGRPGRKNLLPNASMETETVPGFPDYWTMAGSPLRGDQRIGAPRQAFGGSSEQPFHGARCLLVAGGTPGFGRIPLMSIGVDIDRPTTYTVSAYLRANRDGVACALGAHTGGGKFAETPLSLTREWTRYSHSFTTPAGHRTIMVRLSFHHEGNQLDDRLWMDAVQLEAADAPTEFEE